MSLSEVLTGQARWHVEEGDCLEVMRAIPDRSVDAIICDLPYGTTACKWDTIIPLEPLWAQYKRVIKKNGVVVLTAMQPFTSALVMSNPRWFKYDWIWRKPTPTSFLTANYQPLREHETICVFSEGNACWAGRNNLMPYFPQGLKVFGKMNRRGTQGENYARAGSKNLQEFTGFPRSVLDFEADPSKLHPTQKPVALMEYLIRTYSNEGDLILDNACGSGTTLVAALNTGRRAIGIEKEPRYVVLSRERIAEDERRTQERQLAFSEAA